MAGKTLLYAICTITIALSPGASGQTLNPGKYDGKPQTITRLKAASVSIMPEKWNKQANWLKIETLVREAAARFKPHVIVTPEGALEGYVINEVNAVKDPEERARTVRRFIELGEPLNGPYIKKASTLARELKIFLVLGFLERSGDRLLNTAALFDPEGDIIGKYSKTHFAQGYTINPTCYVTGEDYPVFDTPFGKAGILICYDRQLPEPARIIALKGAQVLFLPSYGSITDRDGWNTVLLRARAYENRMPLIFSHPRQSLLIDRHGELIEMGETGQAVCYEIDVSPEKYEGRFRNRRPSTYGALIESGDLSKKESQ
ncbi:MAG: hypothetical protein GC154_16430 [bacterium]|nr:hypothetical protein [bacterium]